jgi:glycine cleavage system regulatory protein
MNINTSLVVTILGKDRPGLVEKVSAVVVEHGGDWLESHLSSMAGYFGGILHVLVSSGKASSLRAALEDLRSEGLEVVVQGSPHSEASRNERRVELEVVGSDRPGIISRISKAIADRGINVAELESECTSAPMSGGDIFRARACLLVPSGVALRDLRADLQEISADLMVDINIE